MHNESRHLGEQGTRTRYRSVLVTRRGGPEVLRVVDNDLRSPSDREARIRVSAAPVCLPDVEARYGRTPFAPSIPFVPGYAIVGVVDAIGTRVSGTMVGDRVAALTVHGGYAEYAYVSERQLIPVPDRLDPAAAAPLILNYIVAYQALHRSAKVRAGNKVLIIGASGGIGTAFMQLGGLAGLTMYGLASKPKHHVLAEYGATAIDYETEDFVRLIQEAEPEGLDAVFDGIGGDYIRHGFALLRRGGTLVAYANPLSLARTFRLLGRVILCNLLPNGRSATYYSTGRSRLNSRPFSEDWASLFGLLEESKIQPIIAARFPLLEAARANELLESGQVIGSIVLLAPELV